MLDAIYNKKILEFAGNIAHLDRLKDPQASAKVHSKLCGSTVEVDLVMDGDTIVDYGQAVNACALGQAAASVVGRLIIGSKADEMRTLQKTMLAMLKEKGSPPTGKWEDLKYLEPVRDYPARHASMMLVFDGVVEAVDKIQSGETDA